MVEAKNPRGKRGTVRQHGINAGCNINLLAGKLFEQRINNQHADEGADAGRQAKQNKLARVAQQRHSQENAHVICNLAEIL